jgi:hypothetical protein
MLGARAALATSAAMTHYILLFGLAAVGFRQFVRDATPPVLSKTPGIATLVATDAVI